MGLTLEDQLPELRRGDHVCLLYASLDEQMTAVAPYLRRGIQQNEVCVFAGDEVARAALSARLTGLGVDVSCETAAGRLRMLDPQAVYLPTGSFDPETTLEMLRKLLAQASSDGHTGVRTAGDMSWILDGAPGSESFLDYEAQVNQLLVEQPFLGMCQYDRSRCRPGLIHDVLRLHPKAVLGDKVCSNPYYEPPQLGDDADGSDRLQWMFAQLEQIRSVELGLLGVQRELESMVVAASHDLKEPVRKMQIHLDLLAQAADSLGEQERWFLEQARRSAERLGGLVDGIIDVPIGRRDLQADSVALDDVVAEALDDLATAIADSRAKVVVEPLPIVCGDRGLLLRLFRNLISNAIKFRRGPPQVSIAVTTTTDRHLITVADDGIGIPKAGHREVFGMFKRLHARDAYPGYGIGLASCRQIVECHHGQIWVESEEGTGSTFFVALPR